MPGYMIYVIYMTDFHFRVPMLQQWRNPSFPNGKNSSFPIAGRGMERRTWREES